MHIQTALSFSHEIVRVCVCDRIYGHSECELRMLYISSDGKNCVLSAAHSFHSAINLDELHIFCNADEYQQYARPRMCSAWRAEVIKMIIIIVAHWRGLKRLEYIDAGLHGRVVRFGLRKTFYSIEIKLGYLLTTYRVNGLLRHRAMDHFHLTAKVSCFDITTLTFIPHLRRTGALPHGRPSRRLYPRYLYEFGIRRGRTAI